MPKTSKPTIAEERENISKAGTLHLPHLQVDSDTLRIMPKNIIAALRPMNKPDDHLIFTQLGIAIPCTYLRKFAPLMGDAPITMRVDRTMMTVTFEYKPAPDARSRTQIKGMDALEFEGDYPSPYFHARAVDEITEDQKIDGWIARAVSKDKDRPKIIYEDILNTLFDAISKAESA